MNSDVKTIEKLFDGTTKYVVPSYQRPYRWDPDDAERLVQDVHESYQSEEDEYFIGSMICVPSKKDGEFEIVDGQQRLITLTLILHQLAESIDDDDIKDRLTKMFVWKDAFTKSKRLAVEVRAQEALFYSEILESEKRKLTPSTPTTKVYHDNRERVRAYLGGISQAELKELAKHLLKKVLVIFVVADDRTSSFRLFNVLNDRGVRLNDADLLKNFLFGEVAGDESRQKEVESLWEQMEGMLGEKEVIRFLTMPVISEKINRDRVTKIKNKRVSTFEYCQHRLKEAYGGNAVAMMKALYESAKNYDDIIKDELSEKKFTESMRKFSGKRHQEWLPALLAFLNRHEVSDDEVRGEFSKLVRLLEKTYAQCCIRKLSSGQRDKACYIALESINNDHSFSTLEKRIKEECVDNEKFYAALDAPDFYDASRQQIIKLVQTVLNRIDAEREDDSVLREYRGRITVEHILPQTMRDEEYWTTRFTKEQHTEWKNKIGNLTLLSAVKNAAAKNFDFDRKKGEYERLNKKCAFNITKEVCELPEWNMSALEERHEKIKEEIRRLWWVD